MALPTLTKTWQFNVNNQILALGAVLANNRRMLRSIKNALIGFATNPWAVRYSCDSAAAGSAGDGVDRWAADANLVWANAGVAHSWIVLRQTGIATNYEILISLENGAATGASFSVFMSASAGFTGGSTTARPTATDEITLAATANFFAVTADIATRWSVMQSTDGQCTRVIIAFSGLAKFVWLFEKPLNSTAGWSNPSATLMGTQFLTASLCSLSSPLLRMRHGAITGNVCMTVEAENNALLSDDGTIGNLANEIDSNWMMLPIGIAGTTAGARGRHGTLQDLWIGSSGVASGDTYPGDASNQFAQFGQLIVPWNGGAVTLS